MSSKPSEIREVIKEAVELETEIVPPAPALPPLSIPDIPIKRVFIFLILFYLLGHCRSFLSPGRTIVSGVTQKHDQRVRNRFRQVRRFFLATSSTCVWHASFFPFPRFRRLPSPQKFFIPFWWPLSELLVHASQTSTIT